MPFFRRAKKNDGWLALALARDGIAAARMEPAVGGKPAVALATFFPGAASAESLEKAGKELRAASYRCTTLLSGGEYQMLAVDAPNVEKDELRTAVRWRLKDMLDFPVDDATIDVADIPADRNSPIRPQNTLFAIAARNSVIAARQKLFSEAKLGLQVVDVPEMAQRNISALLEPEGRGVAMLSFGPDGGLLTVSYNAELYLTRRVDVTLEQLLEPDHDRKHQSFDKITLELQRSLDHFERQFSFVSVSKLVLAPSPVTGLGDYLASNLYMPVESLDLASLFDLARVPDLADKAVQQRFFLPLGAALRGGNQQVDLFNPAFEQKKKPFAAATMAQALGLLLAGVIALGFYGNARIASLQKAANAGAAQLEKRHARLASAASDFAPRQQSPALQSELAEAEAQLASLRQVAGVLERGELGGTQGYSEYFRAFARQNVDGLWLTGVSVGAAGNEIGVRGRALDPSLLPGYLGRLTHEKTMQGKAFGSLQIAQAAPVRVAGKDGKEASAPAPYVEFSLQANPEGAQP
ncbi:MAG: pilus assembly protein PilM [Massilia sp.]